MTLAEFIATAIRSLDLPDDPMLIIPSYQKVLDLLDTPTLVPVPDDPTTRRLFIAACVELDQTITRTMPHLTG